MGHMTEQVETRIRGLIAATGPGGKLPSERTIAAESGAGRTTVRLVLTKLAAEGLVEARHGSGYYVQGGEADA